MKTALAIVGGLFLSFVTGMELESVHAKKVSNTELELSRHVGYQAGYEDGQKAIGWIHHNCSEFGSGDIYFIVCKGGDK